MNKPQSNEIEISIFGPGYGESILVHCSDNDWIIIDSCFDEKTKKISPLEYLKNIGVRYDSVKLLIVTHWHDDHIRGLSQIIESCPNAEIAISEAFCKDEFLDLASIHNGQKELGVSEFSKLWLHFIENKKYPKRAIGTRSLLQKTDDKIKYKVESLSPSDAAIMLSNNEVAKLIPRKPVPNELPPLKRRFRSLTPNFASVVLLITINEVQILLGSDMENSPDENIGWLAILNSDIDCKAQIFKIPHHGSITGENPLIWKNLLHQEPISITTPFVLGKVKLPSPADIDRIKFNSKEAYLTAVPSSKKAKTDHFIDKMLKDDVRRREIVNPHCGHVKLLRKNTGNSSWEVQLSEGAIKL
jgi:hypothetical protein